MDKIKIEVTTSFGWATKGEVHEVNNYVCFNWGNEPHFEVDKGYKGIALSHCKVLSKIEVTPEYTMEELFEKIGCEFKIKGA